MDADALTKGNPQDVWINRRTGRDLLKGRNGALDAINLYL